MSSDDSGFDKEAEREKLREKYERDEEGRENTRRMSELLLQGATMTGKHCNQCGDPIFRYDGQEFCPTCRQQAENGGGRADRPAASAETAPDATGVDESTATDQTATDQTADESTAEVDVPRDESGGEDAPDAGTADEPRVEFESVSVADRHVDRSDVRRPPSQAGRSERGRDHSHAPRSDARGRASHDARAPTGRDARAGGRGEGSRTGASDLDAAREALVETLTDLSRRAGETDDAARARELLAAAREAAEALAALDRTNG